MTVYLELFVNARENAKYVRGTLQTADTVGPGAKDIETENVVVLDHF